MAQVANSQYLVFVHTREQERLNLHLLELNQEAAARNQLNAETKATEEKAKSAPAKASEPA